MNFSKRVLRRFPAELIPSWVVAWSGFFFFSFLLEKYNHPKRRT